MTWQFFAIQAAKRGVSSTAVKSAGQSQTAVKLA
ncbi:hypothetical protein SLEP1_g9588 [Rubroshorea leprosula]|uniref:Uncharacterized protein n=1 Tax=Rubroshorea leprosula TaxID=152421 RepID=A0AAV5IGL9_9ROSI|nr:hypothetical protein SLEP1_g9588 [Rubroshorea leprosula]